MLDDIVGCCYRPFMLQAAARMRNFATARGVVAHCKPSPRPLRAATVLSMLSPGHCRNAFAEMFGENAAKMVSGGRQVQRGQEREPPICRARRDGT